MTAWMRCRVASDTERLPLSAYDTVLRETPDRRAISPMFIELLRGADPAGAGRPAGFSMGERVISRIVSLNSGECSHPARGRAIVPARAATGSSSPAVRPGRFHGRESTGR
ncbi:hypothetical protein GCM10010151_31070 [Actinoallomurus spadix]|uniref:Uncharacterized protein n=1 Tax=Actinoallomurus spadix TaxID=79912 RepID=A0ABN0WIU2_9ACTN